MDTIGNSNVLAVRPMAALSELSSPRNPTWENCAFLAVNFLYLVYTFVMVGVSQQPLTHQLL
jgi:hypothetical protein